MPQSSSQNRPPPQRGAKKSKPRAAAQPAPAASLASPPPGGFPIVGVGASAGGLAAFTTLLQYLPPDTGAAFVLVQHLAPTHESILPAILARTTRMPVGEAHEGLRIEPDHVYVIPAQMDLAIEDGHLKLLPRAAAPGRMPIDLLFRSLAEAQGERAIGVVLSGNASDGTLGLKAIKEAGGICLAQEPETAAYPSMPRSAIAAGCVDAVLSPEGIAREIARLAGSPYLKPARAAEGTEELDGGGIEGIFALLKKDTGNDLAGYKRATLLRRIKRRMALSQIEQIPEYARHLERHPDEVQELYQDLLIHVTSFFRNPATFAALSQDVFPRLLREHSRETPLRIWVPGCSTGEEAYSIAICLLESLDGLGINPNIQIFGTDLNDRTVAKARAGLYLENIAADVTPERLERFFSRVDGHFQISKTVRDLCIFARHDLTRDPPFSRLDVISCRNVLIYLEPRVQRGVIANFHYALRSGGLLVLGSSETVVASADLFRAVDREHRIYTPQAAVPRKVFGPGAGTYSGRAVFGARPRADARAAGGSGEIQREVDRILLSRFVPAGVIVDENLEVLQFRGETHPYVLHEPGSASLSLPRLVQKGLLAGVREMIQEARLTRAPVRRPGLTFRHQERFHCVDLEVVPVESRTSAQTCFLVLFTEAPAAAPAAPGEPGPLPSRRETDREIQRLEQELATTQRYLQAVVEDQASANEELQAANEEILSSNEELQSLNEELESAKEELQSSNEELTTLNEELLHSNHELGLIGDDLTNLLAGLQLPVILLGLDLRLRRYTPAAARLMNLHPTDVNRHLSDLRPNFDLPGLEMWILEAMDNITVLEREVQDRQGTWYSLRIRSYKTRDNRIDGAVLALLDIDDQKRRADEISHARDLADAKVETVQSQAEEASRLKDQFLATVSHELRGPLNAISGWVHVLAAHADAATSARGLAAIERNINAQSRLIEDLLDAARITTGKLRVIPRLIDLLPVAEAALETVRAAADAKCVSLVLVQGEGMTDVLGDADRLQQVAWNLLSNAVKFTPRGGRVDVWVGRREAFVQLQVRDTGQGISPEFLPQVFNRFRQEEGTLTRSQSGLGLGLSIVRHLCELHGGTVSVSSQGPGQGAAFTVSLPMPPLFLEGPPESGAERDREEMEGGETDAAGSRRGRPLEGLRLLVVEDEATSREMLTALLEQYGAEVTAAGSAAEALEALDLAIPDLLVSDIGMPGESGYDLLRHVRALPAERGGRVPALAFTAYSTNRDRLDALEAGFQAHLAKPMEPARLIAMITALTTPLAEENPA